ncbi:MAG TPA: hypothetical protein DD979_14040 [Gammaproteobacteria bacterium]|nr:hypothetical protein [Gammaproteobacteria bacterium]
MRHSRLFHYPLIAILLFAQVGSLWHVVGGHADPHAGHNHGRYWLDFSQPGGYHRQVLPSDELDCFSFHAFLGMQGGCSSAIQVVYVPVRMQQIPPSIVVAFASLPAFGAPIRGPPLLS